MTVVQFYSRPSLASYCLEKMDNIEERENVIVTFPNPRETDVRENGVYNQSTFDSVEELYGYLGEDTKNYLGQACVAAIEMENNDNPLPAVHFINRLLSGHGWHVELNEGDLERSPEYE